MLNKPRIRVKDTPRRETKLLARLMIGPSSGP